MARKKSYSSELAHLINSAVALSQEASLLQESMSEIFADAESYRELKPIIIKINASNKPEIPQETPPKTTDILIAEVKEEANKRKKRISKTLDDKTPEEQPNS